ncbi:MAG: hypothetical protein M3384_11550 [Acidobacteriota bacterium]|nr:hypothetical protein [Acidobacteriota bacterium]
MKSLIKKKLFVAFILFSFCFGGNGLQFVFPQDLPKESAITAATAEESPLAAVFYILASAGKDSKVREKSCLTASFARAGNFSNLEKAADLIEKGSYVDSDFISLVDELLRAGKSREASNFLSYLLKRFEDDPDNLEKMPKILIRLGRDEEALKIASRLDDYAKVGAFFEIASAYLESGSRENALKSIESISERIEKAENDRDKAKLGLFYARLGKEEQSLRLLRQSLKNIDWKAKIPAPDAAWIIDDAFAAYLLLGKYQLAWQLLEKQGKSEEASSLIQIARGHLARGDRKKADELLERAAKSLNPNEYGDSFDLGKMVEIYLSLGETEKALSIAKSIAGSEYMRQKQLLGVADFYLQKRDRKSARAVLSFALEQTRKIDTGEEESGSLWTSGRWEQARYQSQIAAKLIEMRLEKEALRLIAQIGKPYLRAQLLTEFVKENLPSRKSAKNLRPHLEEALSLVRGGRQEIFDSNKYDVYAIIARQFAEIGDAEKANDVFAEVLSKDAEMIEKGSDSYLLVAMCKIGVEFEKSGVKPSEKVRAALRNIIKNRANGEY